MKFTPLLLLCAGALLATSCTSMSRGLGKLTANKFADARSGSVWVVPPPQLEPPAPDDMTCYISYRNISDADVDLTQLMRDAATAQGWTLVSNPQEANYRLRASTRFFGEVEPESGGRGAAEAMGWISGAAVGAGTYALVQNATDNYWAGAAAGAGAGGLAGVGMSNASTPREWALIVDIVLEERTDEPVEFQLLSESSTSGTSSAGVDGPRANEGGANTTGNTRTTEMTQTSNYYPHGVRLSVWANQMNMKEDEAMPHIEERATKVMQQLLPI